MERIIKTRTLAELIEEEEGSRPKPPPKPTILEQAGEVCVNCTLPECDERSHACLLRIAARDDPRLGRALRYSRWLETHGGERAEYRRAYRERRRSGDTAGKEEAA